MKLARSLSVALLSGSLLMAAAGGVAHGAPVAPEPTAPLTALATDQVDRLAVGVTNGKLRQDGETISVLDAAGKVASKLPTTVTDESGARALIEYQLADNAKAIITAIVPLPTGATAEPEPGDQSYRQCVISGAVKDAADDAIKAGTAGAVAGGLAGAAATGLLGGGLTIWSGPGALLGAAIAAIPGVIVGTASGAVGGVIAGGTTSIIKNGVPSLFSCASAIADRDRTPSPAA